MSGHSKWANIKRRKEAVDAQKGRMFSRLSREIQVAARQGGPNPEANPRLRAAIEKAREYNLPMDNIQRAIARATAAEGGEGYEELLYEGYGPGGVAVLLEIMTDNRNRTAAEIRHVFSKHGGSLGESGSVAWMFTSQGVVRVAAQGVSEEDILAAASEAGADDFSREEDEYEVVCRPEALEAVRGALVKAGLAVKGTEIRRVPTVRVPVTGADAERLLRLLDALEDHDDVQAVYANFEMADAELEALTRA